MRQCGLLACFSAFLLAVSCPAADLPTCAVMTFEARGGLSKDEAAMLTDRFTAEIGRVGTYKLVSSEMRKKILDEQKFARSENCSAMECAIEAGQLLGARYIVYGSIGRMGSLHSVNAGLVDVENGATLKTATVDQEGKVEELLRYGMGAVVRKLMGADSKGGASGNASEGDAAVPIVAGGGADLADLMAQVREREAEAKRLEEERRAAQQRLAEELARRKSQFEKEYGDYLKIAQSPHAEAGLKKTAWQRICGAWGVTGAGDEPGGLAWDQATGLLKVTVLALGGAGKTGETMTVDLGGGESLELVWIEPGSFMMGSNNGENDEKPVREVTLTKGFWMGKYEVTQGQWERVMGNNPAYFKGARNPVEMVSWDNCQEFIRKLNALDGGRGPALSAVEGTPRAGLFRLPTEAEWEYACRAGTTGDYAGNLAEMGWYYDNSGNTTHPVGQKKANARGLYDMHGNVWEWCQDWYQNSYSGLVNTDPTGPSAGEYRVVRGGGWSSLAAYARCATRDRFHPAFSYSDNGVRVVVSPRP